MTKRTTTTFLLSLLIGAFALAPRPAQASGVTSEAYATRPDVPAEVASEACQRAYEGYGVGASWDGSGCILTGSPEALAMLGDTLWESSFTDAFVTPPLPRPIESETAVAPPPLPYCAEGADRWTVHGYSMVFAFEWCQAGPMLSTYGLTLFLFDSSDARDRCDRRGGQYDEIGERGTWLHLVVCHRIDF